MGTTWGEVTLGEAAVSNPNNLRRRLGVEGHTHQQFPQQLSPQVLPSWDSWVVQLTVYLSITQSYGPHWAISP